MTSSLRPKIAIVTRTMGCGGAERMVLNLGAGLLSKGYEVHIITTSEPGEWFPRAAALGMQIRHIPGRFESHPLVHSLRVGRALKREDFDVIFPTNSERFAHAALNQLSARTRVIPWIHNTTPDAYAKALINESAWNVAVACGPRVADEARRLSRRKQVVCIPNGLELPPYELKARRIAHASPLRLCYVGRIHQESKGVLDLPAIVADLIERGVPVKLDVYGDGDDLAALRRATDAQELNPWIKCHGPIASDAVYEKLTQAHVFVMPSRYEGLPCVPIEAQMCGCVPVASRLPGVTDGIIRQGETGLLVDRPDDTFGFATAIARLAQDSDIWRRMSAEGMRWTPSEYALEVMIDRFQELIEDAISGKYALPHPRRTWLPVNPTAFSWREHIPRAVHRFGLGKAARRPFSSARPS